MKGLNIKLRYETFVPDTNTSNDEEKRYLLGLDLFPSPFTELNIQCRINEEEPEESNNRFLALIHFWF